MTEAQAQSGAPEAATIVIVDDDRDLLDTLQATLQEEGYHVVACSQGKDAGQLIRQTRPRLVMLDLRLGEVPGSEVLRSLRQDPETAGIPVLICSGLRDQDPAVEELREQGYDFMEKPFELAQFLATIRRLLA